MFWEETYSAFNSDPKLIEIGDPVNLESMGSDKSVLRTADTPSVPLISLRGDPTANELAMDRLSFFLTLLRETENK